MPDSSGEKPVEKIQDAAQQTAREEIAARQKREIRALAFQVALFSALGAFAVLTYLVKSTTFFPLDVQITNALQSIDSPLFSTAMALISWPGFAPQALIIPVLAALFLYGFGLHWEAVTALVASILPALLNTLVKQAIQRPRPAVDLVHVFGILNSYSFPSGHVMFYIAFFGFLWFLAFSLLKHSWMRMLILILLGSLIALVGVSRIYLGQHWASDILGASLLGGLTLALVLQIYRWGKKRFFVRQPVP